jgi:hypothetical protein
VSHSKAKSNVAAILRSALGIVVAVEKQFSLFMFK